MAEFGRRAKDKERQHKRGCEHNGHVVGMGTREKSAGHTTIIVFNLIIDKILEHTKNDAPGYADLQAVKALDKEKIDSSIF